MERYRALNLLHPDFRPIVDRFIARCVEERIAIVIVETWRSQEAHEEDLKNGRSWVKKSKHQHEIETVSENGYHYIPAPLAIDIAPYSVYDLHGDDKLQWDKKDFVWQELGSIGKGIGLVWGGDWAVEDMAHFQASWA
jgi:hypothetical protein